MELQLHDRERVENRKWHGWKIFLVLWNSKRLEAGARLHYFPWGGQIPQGLSCTTLAFRDLKSLWFVYFSRIANSWPFDSSSCLKVLNFWGNWAGIFLFKLDCSADMADSFSDLSLWAQPAIFWPLITPQRLWVHWGKDSSRFHVQTSWSLENLHQFSLWTSRSVSSMSLMLTESTFAIRPQLTKVCLESNCESINFASYCTCPCCTCVVAHCILGPVALEPPGNVFCSCTILKDTWWHLAMHYEVFVLGRIASLCFASMRTV